MINAVEYRLPLGNISTENLDALSELIVKHSDKFNNYVLSSISDDDIRYSYDYYNFEITEIDEYGFHFIAPYSYYEGCVDNNLSGEVEGYAEYEIIDNELVFSLEELPWDVK